MNDEPVMTNKGFIRILFILFSVSSCCPFWSAGKRPVIVDTFSGSYTLISASFSEPVKLSVNGAPTTDILGQMKSYGWWGIQAVENQDPMTRNDVLPTLSLNKRTQINLYVTASVEYIRGFKISEGRSFIDLCEYQFHYLIDEKGKIVIDYPNTIQLAGEASPLRNIQIDVSSLGLIIIRYSTSCYDVAKGAWIRGDMTLVYNRTEVTDSIVRESI